MCAAYRHRVRLGLMHSAAEVTQTDIRTCPQRAGYYLQCTRSQGGRKDLYFFTLKECSQKDYEIYNWWCAAAPHSAMKNMVIGAIQTEKGRVTYDGKSIKVFEYTQAGDKVAEIVEVHSQKQTDSELHARFGIRIDS